jgi:hypothetical protein
MADDPELYGVRCEGCGDERTFTTAEARNIFASHHLNHGGAMLYGDSDEL